jgi:hypothetical protein
MIFKFLKNLIYGYNITAEQVILLDLVYSSTQEFEYYINIFPEDKQKLIQNLLRRGFIKEDSDGLLLLEEKGHEVIANFKILNENVCDELFKPLENDIPAIVEEYRKLFDGLKLGSMGSKSSCINKMKKFLKLNPRVTKEEIIKATTAYINSLGGNYQYLQQADYFINKNEGSRLETWIEEIRKNDNPLRDWTTTIS